MKQLICGIFTVAILIATIPAEAVQAEKKTGKSISAPVATSLSPKDYSYLLGMPGFSDMLLNNHFKLYQGYIKNTNIIFDKLDALFADNKGGSVEYAELERRLSWEYNGVLLHEYYFENLGGKEAFDVNSALYKKITEEFGSFDTWKQDFIFTGLMRGIGWAVLYWEPKAGKLINTWVDEHNTGNIAGAKPILVMDVFEHAYMSDYQLDRAKYIEAFFKNIDWKAVAQRFRK